MVRRLCVGGGLALGSRSSIAPALGCWHGRFGGWPFGRRAARVCVHGRVCVCARVCGCVIVRVRVRVRACLLRARACVCPCLCGRFWACLAVWLLCHF